MSSDWENSVTVKVYLKEMTWAPIGLPVEVSSGVLCSGLILVPSLIEQNILTPDSILISDFGLGIWVGHLIVGHWIICYFIDNYLKDQVDTYFFFYFLVDAIIVKSPPSPSALCHANESL